MEEKIDQLKFLWIKLNESRTKESDESICRRCKIMLNKSGVYSIPFLNKRFIIDSIKNQIIEEQTGNLLDYYNLYVVLINYILCCREIELKNIYIADKGIKDGSSFFIGMHELPKRPMANLLGTNFELFEYICTKFGGIKKDFGDISFELLALPRIPVVILKKNMIR